MKFKMSLARTWRGNFDQGAAESQPLRASKACLQLHAHIYIHIYIKS